MDQLFALFLKKKEYLQNCTPRTIAYFKRSYNAFKRSGATELNKPTLTEFVVDMRKRGLCAKSCNDYIAGMNSFFKWLHENEYVKELFKIQRMKEEKKVLRRRRVEIETTKIYLDVEVEELSRAHHKTSLMVELPAFILSGHDSGN